MLKISRTPEGGPEIFYSIQGEGINAGKPAVFLRLGLCNLKCTWCDTRYTWDWQTYRPEDQLLEMPWEDLVPEITQYQRHYLVITGGEPMLQQAQFLPLCANLKDQGFEIEIETNGTIIPDRRLIDLIYHWSVSPKLQNSGNSREDRESADSYLFFNDLKSCHFKFVVNNKADFAEVQELAARYHLPAGKIILMPQASEYEDLLHKSTWLIDLCKSIGYIFSTRLQILFWGNARGK